MFISAQSGVCAMLRSWVSVTSIRQRAASVAAQYGIPLAVSSPEELFAASPDVVHVLTPPEYHLEHTLAALNRGCHVYVEKPLARSVEDCDTIASAAQKAGRQVCVGHSLLFDPFVRRALDLCRSARSVASPGRIIFAVKNIPAIVAALCHINSAREVFRFETRVCILSTCWRPFLVTFPTSN